MNFRSVQLAACVLFCSINTGVNAAGTADPLDTDAALPLKPSLRLWATVGDPCEGLTQGQTLGLSEVVNLALCNNPQTREIWASARIQAAQLGISQSSYLPSASINASGSRSSPGVNQRSIGLSLSYLLYDFGARAANLESARQLLAAAGATQDGTVQTLFLAAVQAFYRTHAMAAALNAAIESERAAKQSHAAAEARYLAGVATPADRLQARTAWSQTTLARITAEGDLKKTQGTLSNVIGLDANQTVVLDTGESIVNRNDFEHDVALLIDQAKHLRPDLQAAEAQIKAAEAAVEAARAEGKPSISLTASSNQNNNGGISSHGSSLGVNISMPIFGGYAPTYRVRAAEAQVEVRQAQAERMRSQVALEVWTAYQDLVTATQTLRTSADLLNSAEQSERMASGRYKAGVGNILDVLNAQSALASARQQRIQSMLDWNISRATLAQSMGNLDAKLLQELAAPQEKTAP